MRFHVFLESAYFENGRAETEFETLFQVLDFCYKEIDAHYCNDLDIWVWDNDKLIFFYSTPND